MPLLVTGPVRVVLAVPEALPRTVTVCPAGMVPDRLLLPSRSNAPVPAVSLSVPAVIATGWPVSGVPLTVTDWSRTRRR